VIALLNSDARSIPLADQSVQCVVTSPPYWGLRDYGTAQWRGGDEECEHKLGNVSRVGRTTLQGAKSTAGHQQEGYKHTCEKCGAVRVDKQIGLEKTPQEYVASIMTVMREVWRVLRDDGVLWLNISDSYARNGGTDKNVSDSAIVGITRNTLNQIADRNQSTPNGLKPKDLVGIPWRVAFALQDAGWYLRSDIIWNKPNSMPESVTDRPAKSHEYIFLLSKSERYYYDNEAIKEPATCDRKRGPALHRDLISTNGNSGLSSRPLEETRNKRTVWEVATVPYKGPHFAAFPPALVEPMILAGTSPQACEHCGAPWKRILEKGITAHDGETESAYTEGTSANRLARLRQAARERGSEYTISKKTIGREPTCKCENNTGSGSSLVLDPFAGSGTVGQVCRKFSRSFVGLDLNLNYLSDSARPRAMNTNTAASMKSLPMFRLRTRRSSQINPFSGLSQDRNRRQPAPAEAGSARHRNCLHSQHRHALFHGYV
jgi:DNA modification methylase